MMRICSFLAVYVLLCCGCDEPISTAVPTATTNTNSLIIATLDLAPGDVRVLTIPTDSPVKVGIDPLDETDQTLATLRQVNSGSSLSSSTWAYSLWTPDDGALKLEVSISGPNKSRVIVFLGDEPQK